MIVELYRVPFTDTYTDVVADPAAYLEKLTDAGKRIASTTTPDVQMREVMQIQVALQPSDGIPNYAVLRPTRNGTPDRQREAHYYFARLNADAPENTTTTRVIDLTLDAWAMVAVYGDFAAQGFPLYDGWRVRALRISPLLESRCATPADYSSLHDATKRTPVGFGEWVLAYAVAYTDATETQRFALIAFNPDIFAESGENSLDFKAQHEHPFALSTIANEFKNARVGDIPLKNLQARAAYLVPRLLYDALNVSVQPEGETLNPPIFRTYASPDVLGAFFSTTSISTSFTVDNATAGKFAAVGIGGGHIVLPPKNGSWVCTYTATWDGIGGEVRQSISAAGETVDLTALLVVPIALSPDPEAVELKKSADQSAILSSSIALATGVVGGALSTIGAGAIGTVVGGGAAGIAAAAGSAISGAGSIAGSALSLAQTIRAARAYTYQTSQQAGSAFSAARWYVDGVEVAETVAVVLANPANRTEMLRDVTRRGWVVDLQDVIVAPPTAAYDVYQYADITLNRVALPHPELHAEVEDILRAGVRIWNADEFDVFDWEGEQ